MHEEQLKRAGLHRNLSSWGSIVDIDRLVDEAERDLDNEPSSERSNPTFLYFSGFPSPPPPPPPPPPSEELLVPKKTWMEEMREKRRREMEEEKTMT